MKTSKVNKTAHEIFHERFRPGAEPRSVAYQQGVLDRLRYDAGEGIAPSRLMCYEPGTAERDAWLAGLAAGRLLWLRSQDSREEQDTLPAILKRQAS